MGGDRDDAGGGVKHGADKFESGEAPESKIRRTYVVLVIERCRDGFREDVEIRREGRRFALQSARNGERRGCLNSLLTPSGVRLRRAAGDREDVGTGTILTWSPSRLNNVLGNSSNWLRYK